MIFKPTSQGEENQAGEMEYAVLVQSIATQVRQLQTT